MATRRHGAFSGRPNRDTVVDVSVPYGKDYPEAPWIDRDGRPIDDEPDALEGMVTGAWLDAQEFPPLSYAIPGLIPEGFGLLVGPPKAGKSWLVAGFGLAVALGGKALGRISVAQRPVLYLALEDGHRRLQSRFRRIMAGEPLPEAMHVMIRAESKQVPAVITAFMERHPGRRPLVILDTLGKVKPPRRAGEDAYSVDYAVGTRLKEIVDAVPGSTLLVVHHSRKAETSDFVDAVSGTNAIAGSADFVMVLVRKRLSDDAVLAVTGRDVTEDEYAVVTDGGLWRLEGDTLEAAARTAQSRRDKDKLSDRTLDVLALVNDRSETTAQDVQDKTGIPVEQARNYLKRLLDRERIRKVSRGVYGPLPVGLGGDLDPDSQI